jgi:hypothetical protein
MTSGQPMLRHLPFVEALASMQDGTSEWRVTSAGLLTLRLFDAWVDEGPSVVAADALGAHNVREAVAAVDVRVSVRALLQSVLDAMEAAPAVRVATVAPRLMAYARALQFDARWALAADVYRTVLAVAHPVNDADVVVSANLQLGACLRVLAEWGEAALAYASAGQIAGLTGDIMNVLRSRIAEANLAIDRGNLPEAETLLDAMIERASDPALAEVQAAALHDRGRVAQMRGVHELSVRLLHEALERYKQPNSRDRVLADIANSFLELGVRSAARDAYLIIAATAQEQYMRWLATVNLMEIASLDRSEPVFEQYRRELADAALPAPMAAEYHYYVGQGYRLFGRFELAAASLERSIELAERHCLNQVLIKAEASLSEVRAGRAVAASAPAEPSPVVTTVAGEIRRMRTLAGVAG